MIEKREAGPAPEEPLPQHSVKREGWLLGWAVPLALFTLLSVVYLRPGWRLYWDHLVGGDGDPLFNLYVLKWAAHQIGLGLPDFWNAPFYYPTRGATTFSDHLIGPGAQLALFLQVVPNAIAGYNFLFWTAYLLTGFTTFRVLRRAGLGWAAALFAGWAFAYAPYRLSQSSHLQLLIAQWIPLTLWYWDRLWAERTVRNALLFLTFYLLHVTGGSYLAYMIHLPLLVLAVNRLAGRGPGGWREAFSLRSLRLLAPVALIAGLAVAALFLPYAEVAEKQGLQRSDVEIWVYSSTLVSYLTPEPSALWFGPRVEAALKVATGEVWSLFFRSENSMFAGFLPTILFLVGLAAWWRRYPDREAPRLAVWQRVILALLLLVVLFFYVRSNGQTLARELPGSHPHLQLAKVNEPFRYVVASLLLWFGLRRWWKAGRVLRFGDMDPWERGLAFSGLACFCLTHPLFYLPLMKVVPGLSGMRVPARFYFFVSLTIVWFAGRGLEVCLARMRSARGRAVLATVVFALLAGELTMRPLAWARVPPEDRMPPVYRWLRDQPDVQALLELPISQEGRENWPMYYSTFHGKPIGNGFSGYEAKSHVELTKAIRIVPDDKGFEVLRRLGFSHLLFWAPSRNRAQHVRRWGEIYGPAGRGWVERVYARPPYFVYRLTPPPSPPPREPVPPPP
jgi:hypothetical protein